MNIVPFSGIGEKKRVEDRFQAHENISACQMNIILYSKLKKNKFWRLDKNEGNIELISNTLKHGIFVKFSEKKENGNIKGKE